MSANTARKALDDIMSSLTRELAAEVVRAEANVNEGPYRARQMAIHFSRVDATLQKSFPGVYKNVRSAIEDTYDAAVRKARHYGSDRSGVPGELDLLTIEQQRIVLETEMSGVIRRAGENAKKAVGTVNLGAQQRMVLEKAFTRFTISGGSTADLAREVFRGLNATAGYKPGSDFANAIHGKLIQINGRNYDLTAYSDLVATHRVSQLENAAYVNQAAQDGIDLVQVDDHNTTAEVCRPFEGTVWSLTGATPGYRRLSECPGSGIGGGPPFHPRCSHVLLAVAGGKRTDREREFVETKAVADTREKIDRYRAKQPPWSSANIVTTGEISQVLGETSTAGAVLKPVLREMLKPSGDLHRAIKNEPLSSAYEKVRTVAEKYSTRLYVGRIGEERARQMGVPGKDLFAMPDVLGHIAEHEELEVASLNRLADTATQGTLYRDPRDGSVVSALKDGTEYMLVMVLSRGRVRTFYKMHLSRFEHVAMKRKYEKMH